MRQIPQELAKVEALASKYAAVKINIGDYEFTMIGTKGVTTCQNSTTADKFTVVQGNRIAGVETYEAPWGMPPSSYKKSSITLLNWDKFLYGVNLIGKRCNISWGAQTPTVLYSKAPTMYTISQSFSESEGSLACSISLIGMMDWLAKDKASVTYTCNGTDTIKVLVEAVLGATLSPFSGQKAFRIVYDTALDGKYDIIIPGPSFKISKGDTRAYTLSRLLYMTDVKLKPGNEAPVADKDTIHALVLSGDVSNQFSINDARIQRFFIAGESESIFQPNKIIVQNSSADYTYYGVAIDKDSHDAMPSEETNIVYGLASDEQASLVANAMLENIRTKLTAHMAATTSVHTHADIDNVITAATATDYNTAFDLMNDLWNAYLGHRLHVTGGISGPVHGSADTTNVPSYSWVGLTPPTIVIDGLAVLSCADNANINLPNNTHSRFQVEGTPVNANVTATNFNTLTSGGDASALHTHAGSGTALETVITTTSGEAVTTGMAVGIKDSTGAKTFKAVTNSATLERFILGLSNTTTTAGSQPLVVVTSGEVVITIANEAAVWGAASIPVAADVGSIVWANTTAGQLTLTAPTTATHYKTKVGILTFASGTGASGSRVAVQIGDPMLLS